MKAHELLDYLRGNLDAEIEIEQFFNEYRSVSVRSVELVRGKIVLKDHYIKAPTCTEFAAHDGIVYEVPPLPERMLK